MIIFEKIIEALEFLNRNGKDIWNLVLISKCLSNEQFYNLTDKDKEVESGGKVYS